MRGWIFSSGREKETETGRQRHTEDLKDLDFAILTFIFQIEDWPLQDSLYLLWAMYISFHNTHVFQLSPMWHASAYLHRCILQSHLQNWNIWLYQRSICNTSADLIFQNVHLMTFSSHPSISLSTPTSYKKYNNHNAS